MIPMDIDIRPSHSLPATALRSFHPAVAAAVMSSKRARSPETTFDFDRPAKRLVLGMREDAMDSADFSDSSFGAMLASASSSRYPSEDWVRQAKGLSIDNTAPYDSRSTNSSYENLTLGAQASDVDMMDSDETQHATNTQQMTGLSESHRYTQYANLPPRSHPYLQRPEINITPATPTSTAPSVSSSTHDLSELRHTLIPSEGSSMSISPSPSFSEALSPQSPLRSRPKFSMGPRADCEKCRLGVKGHWAHFN